MHLLDPVALHIEQAEQTGALASVRQGGARDLPFDDATADVVLLTGPLYHLLERTDRVQALREGRRVLRPGDPLGVTAISRFASALGQAAAARAASGECVH